MAFAAYRPHYVTVKSSSGDELGQVRALNDTDLSLLWQKHEEAMETVYQAVTKGRDDADLNLADAAMVAIRTAPDLVTDLICLASGEDDWAETFRAVSLMPFGMRLEILMTVVDLTLNSEGGLEKLFGLLNLTRPQADR